LSYVLVLLVAISVVVVLKFFPRGASILLLYPRERCYKEGNRVNYNMITIRTLFLLTYFTYIFIDIIIYVLRSMTWSSRIFWMVGRVVADPSLGLLSPCEVVLLILILVSSPRVLHK
jgi:hypothetical protein